MESSDPRSFVLDDKPVFDWNRFPIGKVADLRKDPRTKATNRVVVSLTPEAKSRLASTDDLLEIPISYVAGIRKDAVSLDRSVEELKRLETMMAALR